MNHNTNDERLQDLRANGKPRPWKEKKLANELLVKSFLRLGEVSKAERASNCSLWLQFEQEMDTNKKRLKRAVFCRERLCPMCQWRKSLRVFAEVSRVMDEAQRRYADLDPVFLTLTVKNCLGDDLYGTVDKMQNAWNILLNHRQIKGQVKGWFRALEVTISERDGSYHPHFHVIMLFDKGYFKADNAKYIGIEKWVYLWRLSMKLDYDPVCDIRKIRTNDGKHKAVAEVAKYAVKDAQYLSKDEEKTDERVGTLGVALYKRRLWAFGGILKKIAKELGVERPEDGDLINIGGEIREDIATVIIQYNWGFGAGDYIRKR